MSEPKLSALSHAALVWGFALVWDAETAMVRGESKTTAHEEAMRVISKFNQQRDAIRKVIHATPPEED